MCGASHVPCLQKNYAVLLVDGVNDGLPGGGLKEEFGSRRLAPVSVGLTIGSHGRREPESDARVGRSLGARRAISEDVRARAIRNEPP